MEGVSFANPPFLARLRGVRIAWTITASRGCGELLLLGYCILAARDDQRGEALGETEGEKRDTRGENR